MTMTATDLKRVAVHEALAVLGDAYGRAADAATADLWTATLNHSAEVITGAARAWVATEDRYPSIARFGECCTTEARRVLEDAKARRAAAYPTRDPEGLARAAKGFAVVRACLEAKMTADESLAALEDAGVIGTDEATVLCLECMDTAAVFRDDGTVRPCSRCEPDQYDRWVGGHFARGHSCETCRAARGRRASA